MQRDKASLHNIVTSMRLATGYLQDRSIEQFSGDSECIDAIVRRLEIIGEAVKRLFPQLRDQHPDIPWQKMAGMRDRLIHGYDDVNLEDIYKVITEVIPSMIPRRDAAMRNLPDPI